MGFFCGAQLICQAKGLTSPEDLAVRLQRCTVAPGGPGGDRYAPKPEPDIPGATDRSSGDEIFQHFSCLLVLIEMLDHVGSC